MPQFRSKSPCTENRSTDSDQGDQGAENLIHILYARQSMGLEYVPALRWFQMVSGVNIGKYSILGLWIVWDGLYTSTAGI